MWDVSEIPTELIEDYKGTGRSRLIIHPRDLYPAMVEHIQDVLKTTGGKMDLLAVMELYINEHDLHGATQLFEWVAGLPKTAWTDALLPRSDFKDGDPRLADRRQALEAALSWFTRAIRMACRREDKPVVSRTITNDPDYRL